MQLPELKIRGRVLNIPIIQGGMGVGISLAPLASSVAKEGGTGIISSAIIHKVVRSADGAKLNAHDALCEEVRTAQYNAGKKNVGAIGVNIMVYAAQDYESSVRGAVSANADMIISGAGLPLQLPDLVGDADIAIIPIVSSLRALKIIYKRWIRSGRIPDAVVVEGPKAGGHLGFKVNEIDSPKNKLENIFPPIKDFAQKNGDFPVIVAGGIYTHDDIVYWLSLGADGIQMGTRFLATSESSADLHFKQAVVNCKKEDIVISHWQTNPPGSPSGMPFRIIKSSPMFCESKKRVPLCNKGAVLQKDAKGKYSICNAKEDAEKYFCICNGLLSAAGYEAREKPLWTVGTNAWRIENIISVKKLMDELKG